MPLYEYECASCSHRFDRITSMGDADQQACPRCGTERARRLLSVIAGLGASRGTDGASMTGPIGGGGGGCGGGCACSC